MKVPKSIQVAGFKYRVKDNAKLYDDAEGVCDFDNCEIKLNKNLGKDKMQVLFHEVLHAVDMHYNNFSLGEDQTERLSQGCIRLLVGWLKGKG